MFSTIKSRMSSIFTLSYSPKDKLVHCSLGLPAATRAHPCINLKTCACTYTVYNTVARKKDNQ